MEILAVIITYSALTIVGIVSMFIAFRNTNRPIELSIAHALLTLVGFGIFTAFMVKHVPMGTFSWPRVSYFCYALAGMLAFIAVILNKLFSLKLPKWIPASYGTFEVLGYAALWVTFITVY